MYKTGTLEEVLEKLYDLYMENRVNRSTVIGYLKYLGFEKEERETLYKRMKKEKEGI